MLLQLVSKLPEGEQWQYEVKWDGSRGVAGDSKRGGAVMVPQQARSREAIRFDCRRPCFHSGGERGYRRRTCLLGDDGKPSFQSLQYFDHQDSGRLFFYAFDLLHIDGIDLMHQPIQERRNALAELMRDVPAPLRFSSTLAGNPASLVSFYANKARGHRGEGRRSVYEPGKRTGKWQELKLHLEEELLIGGFIPSGKGGVDSVVLGKLEGKQLRYVACLDVRMPLAESLKAATN